jgi:CRISPR-associated protein Csy1
VNESYHLIAPLHATSMAHELYTRITENRFSENSVAARKAKRENKSSEHSVIGYPNLAVQKFGGTKPQNISQLNSRRKGTTYLLSCQPPKWENQLTPPQQHKNQFFKQYRQIVASKIKELKKLLITANIIEKNNVHIRNKRARLIGELVDSFILYSMKIQQLKQFSGWSKTCKLSRAQQLWLDPYYDDKDFQQERETNNWQEEIADNFAVWLNKQLETKQLKMDDDTHHEWKKSLKHELAMLKDDIEVISA